MLGRSLVLLALLATTALACTSSTSDASPSNEPADDQPEEQDLTTGATRLASKLQSPDDLSILGDDAYWTTTYGYATQQFAEYHHDIWIKSKSGRAKRVYKNLYGASWALVATKNGFYEINEGYASVIRYPLDGSKPDGESLVHENYENGDEAGGIGVIKLAADDDGFVVGSRSSDDETKPGDVTAYSPAGQSKTKLGAVAGGASALVLAGNAVLVGTSAGEVFRAARSGAGSLEKIASGKGAVQSIVVSGNDTFFSTKEGVYVLRDGKTTADSLLAEGALDLRVVRDSLLYTQWDKGVFAMPLAGGAGKSVFATRSPTDLAYLSGSLFVTDASLGKCEDTDEGRACAWDGAVFRVKY